MQGIKLFYLIVKVKAYGLISYNLQDYEIA